GELRAALSGLRGAADMVSAGAAADANAANALPSADDTIADAYPGVRGGTITVNGHSISVNPGVTTLREGVGMLDVIPGLFAPVDSSTGTIMLAGLLADKKLEIPDSTGLLHALGLQTNVIVPDSDLAKPDAKVGGPDERAAAVGRAIGHVNDAMRK